MARVAFSPRCVGKATWPTIRVQTKSPGISGSKLVLGMAKRLGPLRHGDCLPSAPKVRKLLSTMAYAIRNIWHYSWPDAHSDGVAGLEITPKLPHDRSPRNQPDRRLERIPACLASAAGPNAGRQLLPLAGLAGMLLEALCGRAAVPGPRGDRRAGSRSASCRWWCGRSRPASAASAC